MPSTLKQFLDLVPLEGLKGCLVDFTRDNIAAFSRPKYSSHVCLSIDELEEFLALTFAKEEISILTLKFMYCENIYLTLDVMMGNLYLRNNATLISLEKLSAANLIGKGKLIEQVVVEFSQ
jgi:hypothetical protein